MTDLAQAAVDAVAKRNKEWEPTPAMRGFALACCRQALQQASGTDDVQVMSDREMVFKIANFLLGNHLDPLFHEIRNGNIKRHYLLDLAAEHRVPRQGLLVETFALIAEASFDDRPKGRAGHPSQADWESGYLEGTLAAADAIRKHFPA